MFKLIATTVSIVTFSIATLPLLPASAINGDTKAFVLNDACMAYFPNGNLFGTLRGGHYPYIQTRRFRDGRLAVVLGINRGNSFSQAPLFRRSSFTMRPPIMMVVIPISCVHHVRGRVIEY